MVYGNTHLEQAKILIDKLLNDIRALNIVNEKSPRLATLTARVGLACKYSNKPNNQDELIKETDKLLFLAKDNDRNRVVF